LKLLRFQIRSNLEVFLNPEKTNKTREQKQTKEKTKEQKEESKSRRNPEKKMNCWSLQPANGPRPNHARPRASNRVCRGNSSSRRCILVKAQGTFEQLKLILKHQNCTDIGPPIVSTRPPLEMASGFGSISSVN
jgi:hypothetical protein